MYSVFFKPSVYFCYRTFLIVGIRGVGIFELLYYGIIVNIYFISSAILVFGYVIMVLYCDGKCIIVTILLYFFAHLSFLFQETVGYAPFVFVPDGSTVEGFIVCRQIQETLGNK